MNKFLSLIAHLGLLLIFAPPVSADENLLAAWSQKDLQVKFEATGRQTGKLLRLEVRNTGTKTVRFNLPKFTVLEPASKQYSPILVENGGAWDLPPGRFFKVWINGYSLDYEKSVPRKRAKVRYKPARSLKSYGRFAAALKKGLQIEKTHRLEPTLLSKSKHRFLVLQRVLWRVDGDSNPKDARDLYQDLRQAMKNTGRPVKEETVKALAASIWHDVEKVYQRL